MARDSKYPVSVKAGKPTLSSRPHGWHLISLEKCLNVENRKVDVLDDQEYDLVTVKRSRGGVVRREHLKGKDISVKSQFYIHEGDFLISKRQIVHGACGIVPKKLSGSIVSNEYCVMTGKPGFHLPYMEFLSETLYFQQTCFHSSIGVHIEKMIFKVENWFKWLFNIPPISEQKKIANILSTWDKAINTTERLLANSQQQKKALMQQLLTGKKRLLDNNGVRFSGEWESKSLSDIAEVYQPKTISQSMLTETGYPVYGANGIIGLYEEFNHATEQIAVTCRGSTCGVVNWTQAQSWITGNAMVINTDNFPAISKKFLFYVLDGSNLSYLISGSGQPQITGNIKTHVVKIPALEEQQKIATILSTADQEIIALQQKLDALKQEKKALMQQLLTGKRRVKVEEAA
ncbi:restriction endonuclease subunit S [Aeromonas caviae]|uniref:restriction endonuclease subunit S n=1 Tax=Aeromonas TaxID=642 RepID=UPI0022E06190|nr:MULTISPECIES: restriction endonuclease subunit S [Aeromonas]